MNPYRTAPVKARSVLPWWRRIVLGWKARRWHARMVEHAAVARRRSNSQRFHWEIQGGYARYTHELEARGGYGRIGYQPLAGPKPGRAPTPPRGGSGAQRLPPPTTPPTRPPIKIRE